MKFHKKGVPQEHHGAFSRFEYLWDPKTFDNSPEQTKKRNTTTKLYKKITDKIFFNKKHKEWFFWDFFLLKVMKNRKFSNRPNLYILHCYACKKCPGAQIMMLAFVNPVCTAAISKSKKKRKISIQLKCKNIEGWFPKSGRRGKLWKSAQRCIFGWCTRKNNQILRTRGGGAGPPCLPAPNPARVGIFFGKRPVPMWKNKLTERRKVT